MDIYMCVCVYTYAYTRMPLHLIHTACTQVSKDGFCTVLEHCDGGDLEQSLKERKTLPEREARSIIMQVTLSLYLCSCFFLRI